MTNTTLVDPLQINTNPPVFAPFVQRIDAAYGSELMSGELNLHRDVNDFCTLLAGFRYVELDEQLRANLVTPAPTYLYNINTQNRLYGFQAGGDVALVRRYGFLLDVLAKGGIYQNSGAQSSFLDTTAVRINAGQHSDRAAFLGEIGLRGALNLTENISLTGGYNLLWLEGVVLASDQIPVTNYDTGQGIDSTGGVFYHGATVGLQFTR